MKCVSLHPTESQENRSCFRCKKSCFYLTSFPTVMAAITFFTASFLFSFFSLLSSAFSSKISPGRRQNRLSLLGGEKDLTLGIVQKWLFAFPACCSHKTSTAACGSCQTLWRTCLNEKQSCDTQRTIWAITC